MNFTGRILTCCFFALLPLLGKGQQIAFSHLTVENGLSHNSVLCITQDKRGFMWYGTRNGLNRYDGQRFRIYRNMPADQVMSLFCDSRQTLWVGTTNGLAKYDPVRNTMQFVRLHPGSQEGINYIYEDSKRRLWVCSSHGLYLQHGDQWQFLGPDKIAGNIVRCIYEDSKGILWIGTNNGMNRVTAQGLEVFRQQDGQTMNAVSSITEDPSGRIWIGSPNNGISIYDPARNNFIRLSQPALINNIVRRLIKDRNGKIWIGTQEGLSIADPVTLTTVSYQHNTNRRSSLSQNSIHGLYEDNNGTIWIGTYFGGINMTHSYGTAFSIWQSDPPQPGLSNNVISSMVEDEQHNLWIGTEGGGLNYYNRTTGSFTHYKHDPDNNKSIGSNLVKVVFEDKDHQIWTGTHGGGLNLLQPNGSFKKYLYNSQDPASFAQEITSLLEDREGRFWIGANNGLRVMHRHQGELMAQADSGIAGAAAGMSIRSLYQDSQNRIFIGTITGLYVYAGGAIKQVRQGYINSVQEDTKGNIWVSLYYGGLAKYDPALQHAQLYTDKDGLPHNNVMGWLEDEQHHLWISTDNGLAKFDPVHNTFRTYTTSDGIAGNDFNYNSFLKDSHGQFLFGGFNGITGFYPDKIITNTYTAPILFTGLRLFNNPVGIGQADKLLQQDIAYMKALSFRHDQAVFTLEFALLNFVKSNKNRYAYKLEGADRDWIETNTPSVTYANLSSGDYTLWVKGANNDGIWSQPIKMEITILPPFWRTCWAYGLYALLVALFFFLTSRFFFLRALLRKEEELHQVKLSFFTNVSHEIRTHLTLLLAPVEKMMDTLQKDDPLQSPLQQLRNNADRLLKLVGELMDFRKAETRHLKLHVHEEDLIPYLDNIYSSFRELSLERNISMSFTYDMDHAPAYIDTEQLEKVFFNLLSNAFKFTPDGGSIQLHLTQRRHQYLVTVTDNGRGIAPEYLDKLFTNFFQVPEHGVQHTGYGIGLALSKHIVEQHHGTLTVESDPAAPRTCFTVTLLQGALHFEGTQHSIGGVRPEEPAALSAATYTPEELILPDQPHPFTIHIVEDNPELRDLIRQTFQGQYEVMVSENGAAGLALGTAQIPDLVISDVMMPEMDGLQFCHALKTDERTSHIPVILLTAKSSQADHVSGLETGADLYLTKPFSPKVLSLSVRNLLAAREKMRERFSAQLQIAPAPLAAPDILPNSLDTAFLEKVMALVEEHMDDPEFGVDMLARKVAMSQPVLYKKLKAVTNMSVNDFVKSLRLKKAAALIRSRQHTVYEVAYMVGYNDRKYFSREFKKQYGKTPTEFAAAPEL